VVESFKQHRYQPEDPYYKHEVAIVDELNKEMAENSNFLSIVVYGTGPKGEVVEFLSPKEEQIALSAIQWLGTPVGESFLKRLGYIYTPLSDRVASVVAKLRRISFDKVLHFYAEYNSAKDKDKENILVHYEKLLSENETA
jgi:hypothetical protein